MVRLSVLAHFVLHLLLFFQYRKAGFWPVSRVALLGGGAGGGAGLIELSLLFKHP